MTKTENKCVTCDLPCIYDSCHYYNVEVHYCDMCNREADYNIDNEDFCEECANKMLTNVFEDLSVTDKAAALGFSCEEY